MDSDGNCLFRSVADQLNGDESMHAIYRAEAVQYILDNKEMYTPFIEDDETIEQYCNDMRKDGIWGGQLEMNAMAYCFNFNVIIHQVDNPSIVQVFNEPITKFPTIHLSFHLNEHYNSVRRGDDTCIRGESPIQAFPIGYDLDKVKSMLQGMKLILNSGEEESKHQQNKNKAF